MCRVLLDLGLLNGKGEGVARVAHGQVSWLPEFPSRSHSISALLKHSLCKVELGGRTGQGISLAQLQFESEESENIPLRTCGDRTAGVEPFRPT